MEKDLKISVKQINKIFFIIGNSFLKSIKLIFTLFKPPLNKKYNRLTIDKIIKFRIAPFTPNLYIKGTTSNIETIIDIILPYESNLKF